MRPLIFIHGFKGSTLVDARGRRRWVGAQHALRLSTPSLSLPLDWDDEGQGRDGLGPGAPLRAVLWEQVYGPFLRWAEGLGRPFRAFAYDWRRDNRESLAQFLDAVRALGPPVQVVAHSMGGLMAFAAMRRAPELFHSALFAGVPFGAGVSFLKDMHLGSPVGLNRRLLDARTHFSFTSPYCFFPLNADDYRLTDPSGASIDHDWYDADSWERHGMSVFSGELSDEARHTARAHLRRAIEAGRAFREEVEAPRRAGESLPPIAALMSGEHQTVRGIIKGGAGAVRGFDFETGQRVPGDGRVSVSSAHPPAWTEPRIFRTGEGHSALLNDTEVVRKALVF